MHGNDIKSDIPSCKDGDHSNYHNRAGTIPPESAHTIQCKLCNRQFHAQSRTALYTHLKKHHDTEEDNVPVLKRYNDARNFYG